MSLANPTLVEQLESYLVFETAETAEECPTGGCYHYYRAARLVKQIVVAKAAEAAGTPMVPILRMNKAGQWVVASIWDANGFAIPGSGGLPYNGPFTPPTSGG